MVARPISTVSTHPQAGKCACRGVRYCALCLETERVVRRRGNVQRQKLFAGYSCMVYDARDGMAHRPPPPEGGAVLLDPNSSIDQVARVLRSPHNCADCFPLKGLKLVPNFVSQTEEQFLLSKIDKCPWAPSQSGRRKQDFGPRVNFKSQRVNGSDFKGLPDYTEFLLQRIGEDKEAKSVLADFAPVELCNLEYERERLSSIDMHKDDSWIWGERLVSISLNSDCMFTLEQPEQSLLIFVPVPRRSLLCLFGEQRFVWNHGIFPWHIHGRRIVITLRELAENFLSDRQLYEEYGKDLLKRASFRITI